MASIPTPGTAPGPHSPRGMCGGRGVAVEDTGVTNWGHHLAQELFSILSYLAQERPLWT